MRKSHKDGIKEKDIFLSTVNPDGSTTTPTTKLRVADGSIAKDSKDAINGGQLKTELDKKLDGSKVKLIIKDQNGKEYYNNTLILQ